MPLISLNGEQVIIYDLCDPITRLIQVMANRLLLVLYSPILREHLLSEKDTDHIAVYLPLSTEAIMALLELLAKGRTFSSEDTHLLEVVLLRTLIFNNQTQLCVGGRGWDCAWTFPGQVAAWKPKS